MRFALIFLFVMVPASTAFAGQQTHTVTVDGIDIIVKIIESFDKVITVRAECVVPRPHKDVWRVLTDYEHIKDIVPAVKSSRIVSNENDVMTLHQEGHAGLWFIKRGFKVSFHVREVPMAYVGFEAFEGDFEHFKGTWQVAERDGGTWISHKVEIQPRFFAPRWAVRRVARNLMNDTIEGVIQRCFTIEPGTR